MPTLQDSSQCPCLKHACLKGSYFFLPQYRTLWFKTTCLLHPLRKVGNFVFMRNPQTRDKSRPYHPSPIHHTTRAFIWMSLDCVLYILQSVWNFVFYLKPTHTRWQRTASPPFPFFSKHVICTTSLQHLFHIHALSRYT